MMKLTRLMSFAAYLAVAMFSTNAAALSIDFSTGGAGAGGSLDGVFAGNVTGTDILIGNVVIEGAPNAATNGSFTVDGLLNFDTAANTISIVGSIADLGIGPGTTLMQGSFFFWEYSDCTIFPGTPCEALIAAGPDTKSPLLLELIGVPANTEFAFFGFSLEAASGNVISTDILNQSPIPVPAAVWLFGSGLLGLVGIARRRAR